jgi:hypothetical protein
MNSLKSFMSVNLEVFTVVVVQSPIIVNDWLMLDTMVAKEFDRRYIEHSSQLSL